MRFRSLSTLFFGTERSLSTRCVFLYCVLVAMSGLGWAAAQEAASTETKPGKKIFLPKSAKAAAYVLKLQSNEDLVQLVRSEPVYVALLERAGLARAWRQEAAAELAKLHQSNSTLEMLAAMERVASVKDENDDARTKTESVLHDLGGLLDEVPADSPELADRGPVVKLVQSPRPLARQLAFALLIRLQGDAGPIARAYPESTADVLLSTPLIPNESLRASLLPVVRESLAATEPAVRQAALLALSRIAGQSRGTVDAALVALDQPTDVSNALEVLSRVPRAEWSAEQKSSMASKLAELITRTPASERTVGPGVVASALAKDLIPFLPTEQADSLRKLLADSSVQQFELIAPYQKMIFSPNVIVVPAGRPIEIRFVNQDEMPHNLLVAEPGRFEDVGLAAQAMATTPAGQEKGFAPEGVGVLHASPLIWPEKEVRLSFVAPTATGTYPFLCTFPGHWLKMFGAMIVVEDVDAYMANHQALPTAEELLGKQIVKEWTFADLEAAAQGLFEQPRSLERGKSLFTKLSCISCHRIGDHGLLTKNIGPELTKVAEKYKSPEKLLHEIVEPSKTIEDQFASIVIIDVDGNELRGVVVERDATQIKLKENPLLSCEATVVKIEDIDQESRSTVSPMPAGLLNTLQIDEIMDLLAFVWSGGK